MTTEEYATPIADPLFLERLDTFMQKSLSDIRAFSEREELDFDETRRFVAQWHARQLFDAVTDTEKAEQVRSILIQTSQTLESLAETADVQSFLLTVDPHNPDDVGFLGGSLIGREFWRGLRGGGDSGAQSFRAYAQKRMPLAEEQVDLHGPQAQETPPPVRSARQTKLDLYEAIRMQLRQVSGIRKAEMKWSHPERLSFYGVRMVGWPEDIPTGNPSTLKALQNQRLLELLQNGTLRFERTGEGGAEGPVDELDEYSWVH